jgi:uncharacterized protein YqeY
VGLYERVEQDLADARRRSDALALASLGLLKSEVVKQTKEKGFTGGIDDQLVLATVRGELKRREEAAAAYESAGRQESAQRERAAADVLKVYLPAQLSAGELEAAVREVIAEVKPEGPAGFGMVMKEANRRLAGRAAGSEIAATARRLLG